MLSASDPASVLTPNLFQFKTNRNLEFFFFFFFSMKQYPTFLKTVENIKAKEEQKDVQKGYALSHYHSCKCFIICRSWNTDAWFIPQKRMNTFLCLAVFESSTVKTTWLAAQCNLTSQQCVASQSPHKILTRS